MWLELDEELVQEALGLSAERGASRVVELALEEFVQRRKMQGILGLAGTGLWEGDLETMRRDS